MYTSSLRCSPINWAICSVWNFLSTSNVRLKSAGPLLCIGGSPALGWNRNNRGADRLNIRYAGWVENRLVVVFSLTKTSQDDQTWRSRESGSQKAHDNALQPRERRGEKKTYMKLFDYTLWMTFKPSVCDEIPSVFPATAQARWMLWSFCFNVNYVWLRSFTKYSFQYGPDEYLSVSFMLSVCSEDYTINPRRQRIMVCGPTDSEGTAGTN